MKQTHPFFQFLDFLPKLLPQQNKFSPLLTQLADHAASCAHELKSYIEDTDKQKASEAILAARADSKKISNQITQELWRNYITPFDREDIQAFATALYKIPKLIEKVKERMGLLEPLPSTSYTAKDFSRQIDVIVEEADALKEMVRALINKDEALVRKKIAQLYDLELKGDEILSQLLSDLFGQDRDPRELFLRKDIYDMLEKVIDRYRDTASIALQIVLKHS